MDQQVKDIKIKDLVLWTENPRDPIDENSYDQDIVNRALADQSSKWTLAKLAKEMGGYFDYSELPTVVYHGKKPVVYDGNRRIILGKIKHGLVTIPGALKYQLPDFPELIPCNVCIEKIALENVYRKHADTGSWQPLERDIFLYKFMGQEKSLFLILDEATGIISSNSYLNQRFVKEEIFKEEALNSMGFSTNNGQLYSTHNSEEGQQILADIATKVNQKEISTRKNRGKVVEVLEPSSQKIIDSNYGNEQKRLHIKTKGSAATKPQKKQTRRKATKKDVLFGGKLYLRIGEVSNLYRDIVDLDKFYNDNKTSLSNTFHSLIRMSLRLLCESAAKDKNLKLDNYLKKNFNGAKLALSKDQKTTLSTQNVTEQSIIQLLHTGAHQYESSSNVQQTIAISLIVGSILTITHGKD